MTIAVALILLAAALVQYSLPKLPITSNAVVTRIVDGDTIVIEGGERVRLLDIDTPEKGQPCYSNATLRLKQLIYGKDVLLKSRGDDKDTYGRLLRYVFVNSTDINLQMVREGWAHLYVYSKGPDYNRYVEAEQAAKKDGLCVWQTS